MGAYVNPKDMGKEQWLSENGSLIPPPKTWDFTKDTLMVCLVDNGYFTAAAIAYSQEEVDEFTRSDDARPRLYYEVPKIKLYEASDLKKWEIK